MGIYIKSDVKESGFGGVNWIHLTQNSDQWPDTLSSVMNNGV
jgi:hypothetical protein